MTSATTQLRDAYSRSAGAWEGGPGPIYDRLAVELVARSPIPLSGATVADVGTGRGAASRALVAAGARPLAIDPAEGMLRAERGWWRAEADGRALPLRTNALDAVVAAFSFNHVPDPESALAEAARVTRPGGVVLASTYAADDDHPVKTAVDAAARDAGWQPADWVSDLRSELAPRLASEDRARDALQAAGLSDSRVETLAVPFPELGPEELVAWRLGLATVAPWVASLTDDHRSHLIAEAAARLGPTPPTLIRRMIVIVATVSC